MKAKPSFFRRHWKKIAAFFLIVAGLLWWASGYLGQKAADLVRAEMAKRGIAVEWDAVYLTPGPALHIQGLRAGRSDEGKMIPWLKWDSLALQRGAEGWKSARLIADGSQLTIGPGKTALTLENLSLELEADATKVQTRAPLKARVQGLNLQVETQLDYANLGGGSQNAVPKEEAPAPPRQTPEEIEKSLISALTPLREWLDFVGSASAPLLKVELKHPPEDAGLAFEAKLDSKNATWRGVRVGPLHVHLDGQSTPAGTQVAIHQFSMLEEPGKDFFEARLAPEKQQFVIDKANTHLDAMALTRASLTPGRRASLDAVHASGIVHLIAAGSIPLDQPQKLKLRGSVAGPSEIGIPLPSGSSIRLSEPSADYTLDGSELDLQNLTAQLWGGRLVSPRLRLDWSGPTQLQGAVKIEQISLPTLSQTFSIDPPMEGNLSASFQGGGTTTLSGVSGSGTVEIRDAAFYRLPLLGPLSVVLDQVAPGFARDTASNLDSEYQLSAGILDLKSVSVTSAITEITAKGPVDLNQQTAVITGKAKLRGIVGLSTALLSELLTVEGSGPFSDMRWRLKNVPGLAETVGAVGTVGGAAVKGVGAVGGAAVKGLGEAGQVTGEAVKGVGNAAKKVFGIPGKLFGGKKKDDEPPATEPEPPATEPEPPAR